MIRPCEANLGEEAMTSLKTEGSIPEAGVPRPKMESARNSPSLSFVLIDYPDWGMSDSLPRKT